MKHAEKGFTLIEIMIVVAIIAILAAIAIPNFIAYRKTAQGNACVSNMSSIVTACEALEIKDSTVASKDTLEMTDLYKEDGSGFLKKSLTCPAGGTYTIARNNGAWAVTCSKHNADGTDKSEAQQNPTPNP